MMLSSKPSILSPRLLSRIVAASLAFLLLHQYFCPDGTDDVFQLQDALPPVNCDVLAGLEDVLVVLKTGANEAVEKIPAHINTTLRCAPHHIIFSDLEEDIAGHHVYDALDEVDASIRATHPEFEYYRRLQSNGRNAFSKQELDSYAATQNSNMGKDNPAWKLDKWKFLPMAEKALRARPKAKWFVFMEADSYIIWRSLLDWLSHFNSEVPYYLGIQMQIGDVVFAYGGSGFAISNAALNAVVDHRRYNLKWYDEYTSNHWAGDCVLGKGLLNAGVGLFWSWPNLNNEQPANLDFNASFGGSTKKAWCHHAASYHHVSPTDVANLFKFERKWNADKKRPPLRHGDVFAHYVLPKMRSRRDNWDNLSDNEEMPVDSFENCRAICHDRPECMQFVFSGQTCRTSSVPKLGTEAIAAPGNDPVFSGWIMKRVHAYVVDMDSMCEDEDWVLP